MGRPVKWSRELHSIRGRAAPGNLRSITADLSFRSKTYNVPHPTHNSLDRGANPSEDLEDFFTS